MVKNTITTKTNKAEFLILPRLNEILVKREASFANKPTDPRRRHVIYIKNKLALIREAVMNAKVNNQDKVVIPQCGFLSDKVLSKYSFKTHTKFGKVKKLTTHETSTITMSKRKKYLSWEEYFIAIAQVCSLRSKDPNTQVGVVIVNHRKEIAATGYNGLPWGLSDDNYPYEREGKWLETKYPYMVHAEANAIIHARQNCEGFILYTTLFPCHECAKLIIQCGIKQVFYSSDKHHEKLETIAAKKMLDDAGIIYASIFPLTMVIKGL